MPYNVIMNLNTCRNKEKHILWHGHYLNPKSYILFWIVKIKNSQYNLHNSYLQEMMNFKKAPNISAIKIKCWFQIILVQQSTWTQTHRNLKIITAKRSQYFPNFKYIKNTRDHCLNKFYKNICCTCNIFTLTVASSDCVSVIQNRPYCSWFPQKLL